MGAMAATISLRIGSFLEALPLQKRMRVLEIGCGPGVAARAVSRQIGNGFVLAIDRSEFAIRLAVAASKEELSTGRLEFRHLAIEDFQLASSEEPFDLAFAIRVGALDGRHPEIGKLAIPRIKAALKPGARLFIDGGNRPKDIPLDGG